MTEPPFDLERFVSAQDTGGTYQQALGELRDGRKRSHWMWFVFPQVTGLGSSPTSKRYAIRSLDEAAAYLKHPLVGTRLVECVAALLELGTDDADAVMGSIDALKLRSSMTLFARVPDADPMFDRILAKYFHGQQDPATIRLL